MMSKLRSRLRASPTRFWLLIRAPVFLARKIENGDFPLGKLPRRSVESRNRKSAGRSADFCGSGTRTAVPQVLLFEPTAKKQKPSWLVNDSAPPLVQLHSRRRKGVADFVAEFVGLESDLACP